jgi:hypothetical protein
MGLDVRKSAEVVVQDRGSGVVAGSVIADLVAVAIFVAVGRASHNETLSLAGLLTTAWPFVIGVGGGYVGLLLARWPALSLRGGSVVAVKTVIIGLVLRYAVQRDGTPPAFVLVTVLVLTALMLGWRLLALNRLSRAAAPAD